MTDENNTPAPANEVTSEPPKLEILSEDKKSTIREKMWNYMAKSQNAQNYNPHNKIPNFTDNEAAANMLTSLDVFKNATNVKVDPDKPLQAARLATLKAGKSLYMPTPRHRPGLVTKITPPEDADDEALAKCVARQIGNDSNRVNIALDEPIKLDLVVVGCVAVSPKGWRVGKGLGYSDLEYAMMASNGLVTPPVPVVTMVADSQVVDLTESLFDVHDVAVDYIVTPTRVIQCTGARARPDSITWSLLPADRLDRLHVLKRLRYRDWKAGKQVMLSGETEQPTELTDEEPPADGYPKRRSNYRRRPRRPHSQDGVVTGDEEKPDSDRPAGRGGPRRGGGGGYRRFRRRPGGPRRDTENGGGENGPESEGEGAGGNSQQRRRRPRYSKGGETDDGGAESGKEGSRPPRRPRRRSRRSESETAGGGGGATSDGDQAPRRGGGGGGQRRRFYRGGGRPFYSDCEGSVYVGALPRFLRVSDFKAEVRDRNVQPLRVVWRGSSGYAFLGFKTTTDAEQALTALEGLHIDDHNLRLEMAKSSGRRRGGGEGRQTARSGDSGGGDDHVTSEGEEE